MGIRTRSFLRRTLTGVALAGALGLSPMMAFADEAAGEGAVDDGPNKGRISLSAGFDVTSSYFFRGFAQENQGFIVQPWVEVGFNLYEGDGALGSLDLAFGSWNSLHSNKTLATSDPSGWYEADFYASLSAALFDDFSASFVYTAYMYPGYSISTIEEVGVVLGYTTPEPLFGVVSVDASTGFYFETSNGAGGAGTHKYFELCVTPSIDLTESISLPVTFSVPMKLGLDMDDYYGNETYGFFDIGFVFSMPLSFIPSDFGAWEAYAGVHYLHTGDGSTDFAGAITKAGEHNHVYGTFGISMSY